VTEAIRPLLERRARETLVGRDGELTLLRAALEPDGPLVSCLHGIAGVGKTTLLEAFLVEARASGATVVRLDCRTFEPTPAGFLHELARGVGSDGDDLVAVTRRLGDLGDRVVLALDTYEVVRLLDGWLRTQFVPALGANVRLVLAGRELPIFAWETAPGWRGFFRSIGLGPLSSDDATQLLGREGVDPTVARKLNRIVRGHPLGLVLGASALHERPDLEIEEAALQRVLRALARAYLDDLDDTTREVLDAASVVRRMTHSLLHAMLPGQAPEDGLERLRRLPFVEVMRDGLVVHETMQQAIAGVLRSTDPERYRSLRRAAWRQLRREVGHVGRADLWRYTADMLFLIENPVPREAFFPSGRHPYAVDEAQPGDGPTITAIMGRHLDAIDAAAWRRWWERLPQAFRVVREAAGSVAGFALYFDPSRVPRRWQDDDAVTAFWADHLDRHPLRGSGQVLYYRGQLDRERGDAPGGVQAACWLDLKRAYMELRPRLQRVYGGVYDLATYGPIAAPLGFQLLPGGPLSIGTSVVHPSLLDFGPGSVDAWLAWLVASELGISDEQLLDPESRQLVLDGRRVDLTQLECGVLAQLLEHRGKALTRRVLLERVWGYEHATAGSNVVDVVIRSLRAKLGDRAGIIETVRGLGYRLRAD